MSSDKPKTISETALAVAEGCILGGKLTARWSDLPEVRERAARLAVANAQHQAWLSSIVGSRRSQASQRDRGIIVDPVRGTQRPGPEVSEDCGWAFTMRAPTRTRRANTNAIVLPSEGRGARRRSKAA